MIIRPTSHAILRVLERVNKISTPKEAHNYLIDKFERMYGADTFNGRPIKYGVGNKANLFLGDGMHKFLYEIKYEKGEKIYIIITYFLYDTKKYKKYIKSEMERIENIFLKK